MTFLDQFGRDLIYFIAIAKGMVSGAPPYSIFGSYYPPLTTLLMAPLAFLPALPTYLAWTLANLAFLVHLGRGRRAVAWAPFTPVLFTVFMGNMDLAAVWLAQWLDRKDWKSIAAALLITLKPQMAFILLPYWLVKWLRTDRVRLAWFAAISFTAHAIPILFRPTIYSEWIAAVSTYGTNPDNVAPPGLFALGLHPFTLALAAGIIGLAILTGREAVARAALFFCLPAGHTYDAATLTMMAPAWLLVPASWIGLIAGPATGGLSWLLLPAVVVAWGLISRKRLSAWLSPIRLTIHTSVDVAYAKFWALYGKHPSEVRYAGDLPRTGEDWANWI